MSKNNNYVANINSSPTVITGSTKVKGTVQYVADLYDLDTTGAVEGDILVYRSSKWISEALSGGSGGSLPTGGTVDQILIKQSSTTGDAIWVDQPASSGVIQQPNDWCPNYPYSYVSGNSFSVVGYDVRSLYYTGRALKFTDGANTYTGVITGTSFLNDTLVHMAMDNADVLTNTVTDVCLTTNITTWVPIGSDPFGGTSINAITSGIIGATIYWVAVGDGGKIAVSSNKGADWTLVVDGTLDNTNLLGVAYNATNSEFVVVGNNSLYKSTDGTTFTPITTSLGNTYLFKDILWVADDNKYVIASYRTDGNTYIKYNTNTNDLVGWTTGAFLGNKPIVGLSLEETSGSSNILINYGDRQGYTISASSTGLNAVVTVTGSVCKGMVNTELTNYKTASVWSDGIVRFVVDSANIVSSSTVSPALESIAYSPILSRLVVVGINGFIGSIEQAALTSAFPVTVIPNGFNVLTTVNDVHRNDTDGYFIAVAANGQICRSTNGVI